MTDTYKRHYLRPFHGTIDMAAKPASDKFNPKDYTLEERKDRTPPGQSIAR